MKKKNLNIAIATISDSRNLANDKSGDVLEHRIKKDNHNCFSRSIIKDDVDKIEKFFNECLKNNLIDVIITTGGTGLTGRDSTPEVLQKIIEKEIPGFGEIFRQISFKKIGTSALQSRALAGISKGKFFFSLPGSPSACIDAWDNILKFQLNINHKPCNLIELIPRLLEK
tara:strand:+ start:341 stop:850 length:510 start_codon:yes stop_codon:yes gene_type:complete